MPIAKVVGVTAETTDAFLDELATWAESKAQDVVGSIDDAELLCDLAQDHLGQDLAELTPGDLRLLLLKVLPRKISVRDADDTEDVIPTMRAVCGFLEDTGRIKPQQHDALMRELDDIEPRFADAVMDPANWGMARTITQSMLAEGIDIEDQDDATRWIDEFNAREAARRVLAPSDDHLLLDLTGTGQPDFDEDLAGEDLAGEDLAGEDLAGEDFAGEDFAGEDFAGEDFADEDSVEDFLGEDAELDLAPVRLAPPDELAAAARACHLLTEARRLAAWLGPSRQLTDSGVLRLADARAVITEFGLDASRAGAADEATYVEPARTLRLDQLDSAHDSAPLDRLWMVAQLAGLVDVDGRHATPGQRLGVLAPAGGGDDSGERDVAVLEAWLAAFAGLIHPDFPAPGGPLASLLQGELVGMLTALYAAAGPVDVSELAEEAASCLPGSELATGEPEDRCENAVAGLLGGAAEAGAVELGNGDVDLTPLGVWGVHHILRAHGLPVRAIGDYAESDAADMLTAIAAYDQADGADELAGWVGLRGQAEAAAELSAVLKTGTPVQRMSGIDALGSLGPAGLDAARSLVGEPGVGALAAMWLASAGEDPGVEVLAEDALWVLVDMGAAMLDTMSAAAAVQDLNEGATHADFAGQVAEVWRVDHPRTLDVLTAVADHHPDRAVAKAARKAIFRARSRSAGHAAPSAPARKAERPDRSRRRRKASKRNRRR